MAGAHLLRLGEEAYAGQRPAYKDMSVGAWVSAAKHAQGAHARHD